MKKRTYCLNATILILTILCSMMLAASAQSNDSANNLLSWQSPKNFVDPATLKIQEYTAEGLTNDQITIELEKLGMGWYPDTGCNMDWTNINF